MPPHYAAGLPNRPVRVTLPPIGGAKPRIRIKRPFEGRRRLGIDRLECAGQVRRVRWVIHNEDGAPI